MFNEITKDPQQRLSIYRLRLMKLKRLYNNTQSNIMRKKYIEEAKDIKKKAGFAKRQIEKSSIYKTIQESRRLKIKDGEITDEYRKKLQRKQ